MEAAARRCDAGSCAWRSTRTCASAPCSPTATTSRRPAATAGSSRCPTCARRGRRSSGGWPRTARGCTSSPPRTSTRRATPRARSTSSPRSTPPSTPAASPRSTSTATASTTTRGRSAGATPRAYWLGDTLGGITDRVENALRLWPDEHRDQLYDTAWLAFLMAQHENAWNMQALEGDDPNRQGDRRSRGVHDRRGPPGAQRAGVARGVGVGDLGGEGPGGRELRRRRAGARRARRAAAGDRAGPAALGRRPQPDDRALQPGGAGRRRPQRRAGHPRLRPAGRRAAHGERHVQELPVPRPRGRRVRRPRAAEHRLDAQPPLPGFRRRPPHPARRWRGRTRGPCARTTRAP